MFEAIGKFCYRFRWLVIALWIVLFGVSVVATPLLANVLTAGFANPHAPSQQAAALIQREVQAGRDQRPRRLQERHLAGHRAEFQAAEKQALDALSAANIPDLESIQTYASTGSDLLVSKDGKSSVAVLNFSAPQQTVQKEMEDIRSALAGSRAQDLRHRGAGREPGTHRLLVPRPAEGGALRAARGPHRADLRLRQPGVGGPPGHHGRPGRHGHPRGRCT